MTPRILMLDIGGTIIVDGDIHPELNALFETYVKNGIKILIASDAEIRELDALKEIISKAGLLKYIEFLPRVKDENKISRIKKYALATNVEFANVYYFDDVGINQKIAKKHGFVNSALVTAENPLEIQLKKLAVVLNLMPCLKGKDALFKAPAAINERASDSTMESKVHRKD